MRQGDGYNFRERSNAAYREVIIKISQQRLKSGGG